MVMRLDPPNTCSLALVDDVVAERQGGVNAKFFSDIAAEWRARVQSYIDSEGSPATVPTWPAIEGRRNTLLNLYLSPADGSVQGSMLDGMRGHDLSLCPACGEAGAPNTLDHYLPKRKYPHFCITPYNLFPMCDACQGKKGEKTGDAANPRFFLHPYFDLFVANQVLELEIHPPFEVPTFDLGVVAGLTLEQTSLVRRHVLELGILPRYSRFFRGQYARLLRLVQRLRAAQLDVVQNLEAFRDTVQEPSQNAWEHVFYASVLANPNLTTYLREGQLPAYL